MNFGVEDLAARMRVVEHFHRLSDEELTGIILAGEIRRRGREETIFVEDEPCAGLFVLLDGQVELRKHSEDGHLSIVSVMEPVIMFNEVPALDGGSNVVTAVTSQESLIWRIDAEGLHLLILRYPTLALGLLHIMAARNRVLTAHFEDLSFRTVAARVAKLLLRLSADGSAAIDRRQFPNHRMAAMVSTVPEAFSRALRLLRQEGAISSTERLITVSNRDQLRCFAR